MTQQSIEPHYVDFDTAELLNQKGWNINTGPNCWVKTLDGDIIHNHDRKDCAEHDRCKQYLMQPEQWRVVEWLRINHGIWISVDWMTRTKPYHSGYFCHLRGTVEPLNDDNFIVINHTLLPGYEVFTLPQEAYSAAITYCLEKIIK
jgi:hypothetical protein